MFYWIVYYFSKLLSKLFFPITVYGLENLPSSGSYIIASNHISNIDPVAIGATVPRRISFMAKDSLFKNPVLRWILFGLDTFPVRRETADIGALREAIRRLKAGRPLVMFPEGTRAKKNGDARKIQEGVGFLVVKSGVPVIPVKVEDSDKVFPRGAKMFKRHPITLIFGKPITFDAKQDYGEIAQSIMQHIHSLSW